ncbi:hypothetical protein K504DRAFT_154370 [Pleomassaria siparia CBS 279.74]|uniref:Uncharacterized protein n=1 Tax=Pleomassaria siparia CBS 279.74 TaxID=1314801 RepID=A0A6G1KML5_9PLEO|nr:hypothetical protein K504DRAFT_154370 [Pleomassaria siparia CBS 279.74]
MDEQPGYASTVIQPPAPGLPTSEGGISSYIHTYRCTHITRYVNTDTIVGREERAQPCTVPSAVREPPFTAHLSHYHIASQMQPPPHCQPRYEWHSVVALRLTFVLSCPILSFFVFLCLSLSFFVFLCLFFIFSSSWSAYSSTYSLYRT